jgi:hypothetical protein
MTRALSASLAVEERPNQRHLLLEARDPFRHRLGYGVEPARGDDIAEPAVYDRTDHILSTFGRQAFLRVSIRCSCESLMSTWMDYDRISIRATLERGNKTSGEPSDKFGSREGRS